MKTVADLTRRARLYRFKRLARTALAAFNLEKADLHFIQYGENIIYRVDTPGMPENRPATRFHPNRYVLRIHAMGNIDAIASELCFLSALDQAGFSTPAPVATRTSELVARIITPDFPQGRSVSLLRWLDGHKLNHSLRPHHLRSLGEEVAQLHLFAAAWRPPSGFFRPVWDWETQLGGADFDQPLAELVASMPSQFQQPFVDVSRCTQDAMNALGRDSDAFGLVHADLYPENILFNAGKACPIDFEDLGYSYWLWDIAVALCTWACTQEWERMRDAFHQGYSRFRTLPQTQWAQLDLFVAAVFATMLVWSSAFLAYDPLREAEYIPWRDKNGHQLLACYRQ